MTDSAPDAARDQRGSGFFADSPDVAMGLGLEVEPEEQAPDTRTFDRHRVSAVLVCHDGARWLPHTLKALAELALPPGRAVAVDTGSTDTTPRLLSVARDAEVLQAVVDAPRATGFGAAVALGIAALDAPAGASAGASAGPSAGGVEWLWLLHDDSAPDAEALRRLLAVADDSPSVGVVGPKVLAWTDRRRLIEVGVSISGSGRRETGLDRGELDQGQHDGVRDVLGVGSAGMLVRRDVWDSLGGFDPALALFRDDVDLGWRATLAGHRVVVAPDAVVHHAEAVTHGRRSADAVGGHVHRADRSSALHVLAANAPAWTLPWVLLRLGVGSLLRTLGMVLAKAPGAAVDELAAAAAVLLRPDRVHRARRARAAHRELPASAVRALRPPPLHGIRVGLESAAGVLAGRGGEHAGAAGALESGPTDEGLDPLDARGGGRVRSVLTQPGALLTLGLGLLALVAWRGLLLGDGLLQGGALLPASGGARDLWASYAAAWHDVGVGSPLAAPPYLVPVAALATLLLGKAWLAVDLLLLLAVPLAGLVAYLLLGKAGLGRGVRLAAAVAYALLPAVTGALSTGRLGTATLAWLGPITGWMAARAVGAVGARGAGSTTGARDVGRGVGRGVGRARGSWRAAWLAGLLLAVAAAFVPLAWALAAGLGVLAVGLGTDRALGRWARLGVVLGVTPVLLLPWTARLVREPALLVLEAGAQGRTLADPALPAWWVAVANPGGPGVPPAWVTVALVVAALAALLRADRRGLVAFGWLAAAVGLVAGLVLAVVRVTPAALGEPVPVWPGPATLLVGGGLLLAASVGGDGLRDRLAGYGFGWRQPVAGVITAAALAVPVLLGVGWAVRGPGDLLASAPPDVLPAYVVAASDTPARPRTLVVDAVPGAPATFALVPGGGRRLGDADVAPAAASAGRLDALVSDLLSGRAGEPALGVLAGYGVMFVELAAPADVEVVRTLDSVPGLERVGAAEGTSMWRLVEPGSRVRTAAPDAAPVPVPAEVGVTPTTVDATLPAGGGQRWLQLAEAVDPGWRATLDGTALRAGEPTDGWGQAFALPATGGRLEVAYRSSRTWWLVAQALGLVVVVVLMLPGRRRPDDEWDDGDAAAPDAAAPDTATPDTAAPGTVPRVSAEGGPA